MHSFETTDLKQARRFRTAQFNGRTVTLPLDGMTIKGFVHSVREHRSSVPLQWTVTVIPETPVVRRRGTRFAPRSSGLLADFY
jgi:hypothetical protein